MINFVKLDELDISWQTHGKIHSLLNQTYINSRNFIDKTYAMQKPSFRILAYKRDELIGLHAAFLAMTAIFDKIKLQVAGVGLYAVLPQKGINSLAVNIYKETLKELHQVGYTFALTITAHPVVNRISERFMRARIFDLPVRGIGGCSKRDDKLVVVSTLPNYIFSDEALLFMRNLNHQKELILDNQLF